MWRDMGLYWAWSGAGGPRDAPPTVKRLEYATIRYRRPEPMAMRICCGVFDDEQYREMGREEIGWHIARGAEVTWEQERRVGAGGS